MGLERKAVLDSTEPQNRCPKCKTGIVYKTYDYLDDRNVCCNCGTTHKCGWNYDSITKQVTGEWNPMGVVND